MTTDEPRSPGRPPLGDATRSVQIRALLTPAEAEAMDAARGADSRSEWIRAAILRRLEESK
jgi:hypothetical protein